MVSSDAGLGEKLENKNDYYTASSSSERLHFIAEFIEPECISQVLIRNGLARTELLELEMHIKGSSGSELVPNKVVNLSFKEETR